MRFYARFENEAGDFRVDRGVAKDLDEARDIVTRRELGMVIYRIPPDRLAEIQAKPENERTDEDRSNLIAHEHNEQWKLVYLGEGPPPAKQKNKPKAVK